MLILRHNTRRFAKKLRKHTEELLNDLRKEIHDGVRWYEGRMIKEQMSGRKSTDFGLNTVTRFLKGSWKVRESNTAANDYAVYLETNVIYARIHQFSGWTGRNHASYIPKRLYIYEKFNSIARPRIIDKMAGATRRYIKKFKKGGR